MKSTSPLILVISGLVVLFGLSLSASGQSVWTPAEKPVESRIQVEKGAYFNFDASQALGLISNEGSTTLSIPSPDGKFEAYTLKVNATMHADLASGFPSIYTFTAQSIANPQHWGKVSITPHGFHAMIFRPGKSTWFVDPVAAPGTSLHVAYDKKDFFTDKLATCFNKESDPKAPSLSLAKSGTPYNSCDLRTYRLAMSTTGEYSIFHGGTTELALSAIAVTMNRVNGIYELDFSVTMTLIANNDVLINTDPASDPFTNGNAGAMLNENQNFVNSLIGSANYDIGHVFGTNSGGVAGFGVTCLNNSKARGVTGSGSPIGDPFDVDYVAHEIGHQFGGSHSFNNSCGGNRSDAQAVEPGSGSTIMAYAGICTPNVQNNSDDHFHGINMRQIGIKISNDICAVVSPIENTMPTISSVPENIFIPVSTPFSLTAVSMDIEDDPLTWCWEQMDNEISTQPPAATSNTGPNFRSYSPDDIPTRYFPRLPSLASNANTTWERLPSVSRQMNFRVSVRDNNVAGGCTQWADVLVNTSATAGPFVVLNPSATGIVWPAFSYQTVTWDVANTNAEPINAELVNIYLSTDGGTTYPTLLAEGVENNGAYVVQTPNVSSTVARVMVMNAEGTFFDISNFNFTITQIVDGFAFESSDLSESACQGEIITFDFEPLAVGSFAGSIALSIINQPPGATVELSQATAIPGEVVQVTVSNTIGTPGGTYNITISGDGGTFANELTFTCGIINLSPTAPQPITPENEATGVDVSTTLIWEANAVISESYTIQVATDAAFSNIIFSGANLDENEASLTGLSDQTTYFWRVYNTSACGISGPSETFSFTTFQCLSNTGADLPQTIEAFQEAETTSVVNVAQAGTVGGVRVNGVQGQHPNISDLIFSITSPQGSTAILAAGSCGLDVTLFGNETIEVNAPASVAGTYEASPPAGFGPGISSLGLSGTAVLADDGGAGAELCDPANNAAALNGNIAIVIRGNCNFVTKVLNAQDAGAIGVIVINNQGGGVIDMGGTSDDVVIPSVMIGQADGSDLLEALAANAVNFNFSFDDEGASGPLDCPATNGFIYQPIESLSIFEGEEAEGEWILKVLNISGQGEGSLTGWSLELCYADGINSLNDAVDAGATLYPNPTSGILHISMQEAFHARQIVILDLQGRKVASQNVTDLRTAVLDMGDLSNGLYIVQLMGEGVASYRVVKTGN